MRILRNLTNLSFIILAFISCNDGPKVISAENTNVNIETSSGIFSEENNTILDQTLSDRSSFTEDLHTVIIQEVLPASRYVYLKVTEGRNEFWIATRKDEVKVGESYFYKGGLLKTNFESKEYKKVFDTIYLVSNLVAQNHGNNGGNLTADFSENKSTSASPSEKKNIPTHTEDIVQHKGSIKIADLVANPSAYNGKTLQITGKCVKVNPNIMNRNWIHLQDGSKDDYDLVVTSSTFVPEGKTVTIKAEVSLDRDFGAGYRYDLILENGIIIE